MKTEKKITPEEVKELLRHYVRFHLKDGDLEAVPELRQFITPAIKNKKQ